MSRQTRDADSGKASPLIDNKHTKQKNRVKLSVYAVNLTKRLVIYLQLIIFASIKKRQVEIRREEKKERKSNK